MIGKDILEVCEKQILVKNDFVLLQYYYSSRLPVDNAILFVSVFR